MLSAVIKPRRECRQVYGVLQFRGGIKISFKITRITKGRPKYEAWIRCNDPELTFEKTGYWAEINDDFNKVLVHASLKHGAANKQEVIYER